MFSRSGSIEAKVKRGFDLLESSSSWSKVCNLRYLGAAKEQLLRDRFARRSTESLSTPKRLAAELEGYDRYLRVKELATDLETQGWKSLSEETTSGRLVYEDRLSLRARKLSATTGENETEYKFLRLIQQRDYGLAPTNPGLSYFDNDLAVLEVDVIPGATLHEAVDKNLKMREGCFDVLRDRLFQLKRKTGLDLGDVHDENILVLMDDWENNQHGMLVTVDWGDARRLNALQRRTPTTYWELNKVEEEANSKRLFFS